MFRSFVMNRNKRHGSVASLLIFITVIALCLIIYFGYGSYREKYYINIFDNKTQNRIIDVPPFATRLTDADRELIGECDLHVGTSFDQVCNFYESFSKTHGFGFSFTDKSLRLEVRRGFAIDGTLEGNKLSLRWIPNLAPNQVSKCKKLFGEIKHAPVEVIE